MKDQSVDVRRFIVASLDSFASRIVSDVRNSMPAPTLEFPPRHRPRAARRQWPWVAGHRGRVPRRRRLLGAAGSTTRDDLAKSRAEVAGLTSANAELQRARSDLSATVKDLTAALSAAAAAPGRRPATGAAGTRAVRAAKRNLCPTAKFRSIAAVSTCCASC